MITKYCMAQQATHKKAKKEEEAFLTAHPTSCRQPPEILQQLWAADPNYLTMGIRTAALTSELDRRRKNPLIPPQTKHRPEQRRRRQ